MKRKTITTSQYERLNKRLDNMAGIQMIIQRYDRKMTDIDIAVKILQKESKIMKKMIDDLKEKTRTLKPIKKKCMRLKAMPKK